MMVRVGDIVRTVQLRTLALVTSILPRWETNEVEYEVEPVIQRSQELEVHPEDIREILHVHRLSWLNGHHPTRVPLSAIANLEQLAQPRGHDRGLDRLKRFEEMEDELVICWVRLAPQFVWAKG